MSGARTDPTFPASVEDAAAAWAARRAAGKLSPDDASKLQTWLRADPQHGRALAELERTWELVSLRDTPHLTALADQQLTARHNARRSRRRAALISFSGLAAAAALVFALLLRPDLASPASPPAQVADAAQADTFTIRPDRQVLPDGSVVELNAGAEIVVHFTPETRRVELRRGQALFDVAKNPARPFVVVADRVEVTAVGTAFSVAHRSAGVDLLVTEGRVRVGSLAPEDESTPASDPLHVDAGYRLAIPRAAVGAGGSLAVPLTPEKVTEGDLADALGWRDDRMEFTRTALVDAVHLFNQRNRLQLTIADEQTRALRISGFFWLNDPESFVRLLEAGFELKAQQIEERVFLRAR